MQEKESSGSSTGSNSSRYSFVSLWAFLLLFWYFSHFVLSVCLSLSLPLPLLSWEIGKENELLGTQVMTGQAGHTKK